MPTNMTPNQVQNSTTDVLRVWTANPDFRMKDVTLESVQADASHLQDLTTEIANTEANLIRLRNDRDALALKLNTTATRARAGFKGYFGGDSNEYELVGGTRASDRKRPARTPKPELKAA